MLHTRVSEIKIIVASFLTPAVLIFLSSNFVNAGNLIFNLLFSRLMGPEMFSDLALILTIKLSLLSVLNAVQMLVTERVAETRPSERLPLIARYRFISRAFALVTLLAVPFLFVIAGGEAITQSLNLSSNHLLPIFVFGLPFTFPLCIWRGVAQGRIDLWKMVASANSEMLVRLFGGLILFQFFGLEGVIVAFVLSLIAGWYFALSRDGKATAPCLEPALPFRRAMPWAAMQFGIVLLLDGDVVIAKALWSDLDAGFVAALSLIQRIIFFAIFSLTAVMIPQVIEAARRNGHGLNKARDTIVIFFATTIPGLGILWLFPEFVTHVIFGSAFADISPSIFKSGAVASLATLNYVVVSYAMARKFYANSYVFLLTAIAQLIMMVIMMRNDLVVSVNDLVTIKLYAQVAALVISMFMVFVKIRGFGKK